MTPILRFAAEDLRSWGRSLRWLVLLGILGIAVAFLLRWVVKGVLF